MKNDIISRSEILISSHKTNSPFPKKIMCVCCGLPVYKNDFEDIISKHDWALSGFCQNCQNKILGK